MCTECPMFLLQHYVVPDFAYLTRKSLLPAYIKSELSFKNIVIF